MMGIGYTLLYSFGVRTSNIFSHMGRFCGGIVVTQVHVHSSLCSMVNIYNSV